MAKPELGTKRTDPETGRKFYDLNRDPIISPYTGQSYPRSYFETTIDTRAAEPEEEEAETEAVLEKPEFVSLEEADEEAKGGEDLPDLDDDVELDDEDEDTFLEEEEDDDDDVSGILGGSVGGDDEEG